MATTLPFHFKLRRLNDALSAMIVILAIYIFMLPVLPQIGWWLHHSAPVLSRPAHHAAQVAQAAPASGPAIPLDNRLSIAALGLNEPIFSGDSIYTVNKGIWIRPNASTPDNGSNTVLVGHRFTYTNPRGVFYFLDKIKLGDVITVYWHSKAYRYVTTKISVVDPTDGAVEAPTPSSRLTLYTCTPLWSLKERLVVVSELVAS
ncbi:MAG: sortase [Patescibacteria group bacterium]|nr:sortase [Patescibacteria group bacterium]